MLKPSYCRIFSVVGVAVLAAMSLAQTKGVGTPGVTGPQVGMPKLGPNASAEDKALFDRVERTLVVGLKSWNDAANFRASLPAGASIYREIPRLGIEAVVFPSKAAAQSAMASFKAMPSVRYVDTDGIQQALGWPNDPMYGRQFSHIRTNTNVAWGITVGSADITVAVVDTGIDLSHPEFAGRIVNPMAFGYPSVNDGNGHGTHCAGIASAAGDNGIGVAGVSWKSNIMPIKGLSDGGSGSEVDLMAALTAAADAGANVISYSVGGYRGGKVVPQGWIDMVNYMHDRNCVFVAAAGNDGVDLDTLPKKFNVVEVPCSNPDTFAVASSNSRNALSSFSNFGKTLVDVVAPGEGILSTFPGGYGLDSGTSMACPYISGVSALILSVGGVSMTPAEVELAITSTAGPTPVGCAHGLVNTYFAVRGAAASDNYDVTPSNVSIVYGTLASGSASNLDAADDNFFAVSAATVPIYGPVVVYDATYELGDVSNVHSIMLRSVLKATQPTNSTLMLWDPVKHTWVPFSSALIDSTKKDMTTFLYLADIAKYVDENGVLKVRYNGLGRIRRFGDDGRVGFEVDTDSQGLRLFLKDPAP